MFVFKPSSKDINVIVTRRVIFFDDINQLTPQDIVRFNALGIAHPNRVMIIPPIAPDIGCNVKINTAINMQLYRVALSK